MPDILNHVYFEDIVPLMEKARLRKLQEWRMQLSIVSNPHVKDPKKLFAIIAQEERRLLGVVDVGFDAKGFDRLKNQLSNNPRFVIK